MGTTINGVYVGGKRQRRVNALERLGDNLEEQEKYREYLIQSLKDPLQKAFAPNLTEEQVTEHVDKNIARIKKEIEILKSRI
jgi:hypothetical protein